MSEFLEFFTFAQLVGVAASGFVIAAYCIKSDVKTKKIVMGGSILFAVHFFMMGAFTAMGVSIVNIVRVWLSIRYHGVVWLCTFFVSLYLLIGVFTFKEAIDFLPIFTPILGCIAMYFFSGVRFRAICLIATMSWLVYGLLIGSVGTVLTQLVVSSVNIWTIYRLIADRKVLLDD